MRFRRIRMLVVASLATGLAFYMTWSGWTDLILLTGRETVTGSVIRFHQPAPGKWRASDYQVSYEFADRTGVTRQGEDVLPPALAPSEGETLEIVYLTRDPSVSRIASQLSMTPVQGLLLALTAMGWVVRQLIWKKG